MQKVLIVGSGLTSAITAFLLQRLNRALFQLTVWDKARGEGMFYGFANSVQLINDVRGTHFFVCFRWEDGNKSKPPKFHVLS